MANYTEFYVATTGNNAYGGSSESLIYTTADSSVIAGALTTVVDNTGSNWAGVQVDDWIAYNPSGSTYEYRRVTALAPGGDASKITIHADATAAANRTTNVGGAWGTIANAATVVTVDYVNAAGYAPRVNIKSGTYTETVSYGGKDGTSALPIVFEGYTTTAGDGGTAIITNTGNTLSTAQANYRITKNLDVRCTGSNHALYHYEMYNSAFVNCKFSTTSTNSAHYAMYSYFYSQGNYYVNCEFVNSGGYDAIGLRDNSTRNFFLGCRFTAKRYGVYFIGHYTGSFQNCIFDMNTYSGTHGLYLSNASPVFINGCSFYGKSGGNGSAIYAVTASVINISNSIITNFGRYAIEATADSSATETNNAFFSNGMGTTTGVVSNESNRITLTGDPFADAANGDFTLNNTAGAGAACRATGYPGITPGGTGYIDIGALQHQDSGGTGSSEHSYVSIG